MPAVSKITIHVGASTAALSKGFAQAGAKTKQFGNTFKAAGQQLRAFNPLLAQLGGGLGALSGAISLGPIGAVVAGILAGVAAAKKFVDVLRHGFQVAKNTPQIKAATAAIERLKLAFDGIAGKLAISFAPAIAGIAGKMERWLHIADALLPILNMQAGLWKILLTLTTSMHHVLLAVVNVLRGDFKEAWNDIKLTSPVLNWDFMFGSGWKKQLAEASRLLKMAPGGIAAVTRDTTAGFSAEQAARRAAMGMNDLPKQQLQEARTTNALLRRLIDRGGLGAGAAVLPLGL